MTARTASSERASPVGVAPQGAFPLRRSEIALIFVFWTLLAVLIGANRLLDPRGQGVRETLLWPPIAVAFAESYLWALLTPLVFWMASRWSPDRAGRVARVALFVALGVACVLLVNLVTDQVREAVFQGEPGRFGPRRRPFFGPSLWSARRLSMINDLVTYFGVLAAGIARDLSLRYRARRDEAVRLQADAAHLETQLAEARLDALRRQLDPHFLFNTLHAVSSLVERDPRGVRRMISRLSDLLRHSIDGATEQEIPLEREMALADRYLEIMRIRFQGRLEVSMTTAPEARDALVPNMILQPLVENAIKHGAGRAEGMGRVDVVAAREGNAVVIRVRDNGPGPNAPPPDDAARDDDAGEFAASTGVGVRNTRARLAELYAGRASFTLDAAPDGGAVAELRIPYHVGRAARETRA